jgi:hypothetical protein
MKWYEIEMKGCGMKGCERIWDVKIEFEIWKFRKEKKR